MFNKAIIVVAALAFALLTVFSTGCSESSESSSSIQPTDLIDSWVVGAGKGTIDKLPGGSFRIINENNAIASGKVVDGDLVATDWDNLHAKLSVDRKSLVWANGTVWKR